jgi:transcription-repair coupling factor (superfamily II helicase)
MAMSGIRDMSVLEEAPGERQPVQTYVTEYDRGLIAEAIRKELRRGGQVFYLCNSIERLPYIAQRLKADLPDARIAVANGQMDKEDLSDIWHSMIVGETDILICTTIIETGVDVPNANTLIIENADAMGLSQLHQLRGRVGRSSRRA